MELWEQDTLRAAIRERDEWKARAEAAEREREDWRASAGVERSHLSDAESELETLSAERDRLLAESDGRLTRIGELVAENQRLLLLVANADDQEDETQDWNAELQSRLAAATELVGRCTRELEGLGYGWAQPAIDGHAFLANQPAASQCDGTDACPCPLCWGQPVTPTSVIEYQHVLEAASAGLRPHITNRPIGRLKPRTVDTPEPPCTKAEPVPMVLHCPECKARHIDSGEFATKPHHTHACQECGMVWRPAIEPTRGVQFLPGFKNEAKA